MQHEDATVSPEDQYAQGFTGSGEPWLAVHEAGHAIVGIRSGLAFRGIRFWYDDGVKGETEFEDFAWWESTDDALLRRHIRVDVAGNIAELLLAVREPDGGYPSRAFPNGMPVPGEAVFSDVKAAWERAYHLAGILSGPTGSTGYTTARWEAAREIIAQAEREAEQILQQETEALWSLAGQLQCRSMPWTAVQAIVGGWRAPQAQEPCGVPESVRCAWRGSGTYKAARLRICERRSNRTLGRPARPTLGGFLIDLESP